MNIHEELLNEFHTATGFEMYSIVLLWTLLGFILGAIWMSFVTRKEKTYKQGQIDALNGKVHYVKKENDDGELIWVDIDKI